MSSLAQTRRANQAAGVSRLERLKAMPRQPGEASFFWYETQLQCEAVKVLPGEYFVDSEQLLIMTTLGSCVAACLWDSRAGVGGLNHFMLPEGQGASGRYGSYAMERLINEMLKRGASRGSLQAKVFGGARVIAGMGSLSVGERNTAFVLDYLKTERIPLVGKDVLDNCPRKVCFMPATGKAMIKRLALTSAEEVLAQDRKAALQAARAAAGGSVDLF